MATVGSGAGLDSLRRGVTDFATAHLLDARAPCAGLIAKRHRGGRAFLPRVGLGRAAGQSKGIASVRDLARAKLRFINRQSGSGTRVYLDQQLACADERKKDPGVR